MKSLPLIFDRFGERGVYSTSFLHIFLKGGFKSDLSLMSKSDFGTFVHEYIHYLQEITTIYGLMYSEMKHSIYLEVKSKILSSKSVLLPVDIPVTDVYSRICERFLKGDGDRRFIRSIERSSITHEYNEITIGDQTVPIHKISFLDSVKKQESIEFGAFHIKESMAYLIQSFFDDEAENYDIPYNLVELVTEKLYPNIAKDKKKLICVCYASLFSQYPGDLFFCLLKYASEHYEKDGIEIFKYGYENNIIKDNGVKYTVSHYIDLAVERFKKKIDDNLVADLDAISCILDRVVKAKDSFYILKILYDPDFPNVKLFDELVGYYGCPYIQTSTGYAFPESANGGDEISSDVLELMVQEAVLSVLLKQDRKCPLIYLCSESDTVDDYCWSTPWLHKGCHFQIVADYFELSKKIKI